VTSLNSVSPKLLSFFVIALALALVISRTKTFPMLDESAPKEHPDATPTAGAVIKHSLEEGEILVFVPLLLLGASLFHLALVISSRLFAIEPGSFKDTLNAGLAA